MSAAAAGGAAAGVVLLIGLAVRPRPARPSVAAPAVRRWSSRRGAARTATLGLADFLTVIARELRGGATVTGAFVTVTGSHPSGASFRPARQRVIGGVPLVTALDESTARPSADVDVAVHVLSCAADIGGPAAVAIDAAAAVLRERAAVVADAAAHSAQARLSGRVLTVVPLAFAAWTVVTDARARNTYVASPIGAICVVAGLALNLAGWWWMRHIVEARGGG
jgi:tight adherence protein B